MGTTKFALLDTDFISKMHLIRKDEQNKLIDKIVALPDYSFYCHEQIKDELQRHNIAGAFEWFEAMVLDGTIELYDDNEILEELFEIYGDSAVFVYVNLLKTACDAYKHNYFEEQFKELAVFDCLNGGKEAFLEKLQADCSTIGEGNNLGELKSYVLLQMLTIKLGHQIYVFCSDDKNARNGIVSIGNAKCISVLSSFIRLQKECSLDREEAQPYIDSYLRHCAARGQTAFKIQDMSQEKRMCKVPCEQVFDDMFSGKIEELKNGNLRYIK